MQPTTAGNKYNQRKSSRSCASCSQLLSSPSKMALKKIKASDVSLMQQMTQQPLKVNASGNSSHVKNDFFLDSTPNPDNLLSYNAGDVNPHIQAHCLSPQTIMGDAIVINDRGNAVQLEQNALKTNIMVQAMVHRGPFSSQSQEDLALSQSSNAHSPLSITPDRG